MASVACARKLVDGANSSPPIAGAASLGASDMASLQNDDLRRVRFIPAGWKNKEDGINATRPESSQRRRENGSALGTHSRQSFQSNMET